MHLVYFEPLSGGHCAPYMKIFADHVAQDPRWQRVTWLIGEDVAREVATIGGVLACAGKGRVELLTKEKLGLYRQPDLVRRGFAQWNAARAQAKDADHVFIPFLDHAIVGMAFGRGTPRGAVSGIVFRVAAPQFRDTKNAGRFGSLKEWIKLRILARAARRLPSSRFFTLDPLFPAFMASQGKSRGQFVAVGDPIVLPQGFDNPAQAGGDSSRADGRVDFLMFGAVTRRKGSFVLLEALRLLPPAFQSKSYFQIVGRVLAEDRDEFLHRFAALKNDRPGLSITLEEAFVSDERLVALIKACDVVLSPHQGQIGSSGAMMWSAMARKPVITQDIGLTGYLTREYRLGEAVDTSSPAALAGAIERLIEKPELRILPEQERLRFLEGRSPADFYNGIAGALLGDAASMSSNR